MTEVMLGVLALVPLDVLLHLPSPTPSAFAPSQGPGHGAYFIGGFIGLGILLLAMMLLRLRPRRADRRPFDE
jgi:hypothetical protein